MFGREMKNTAMRWVTQKGRPGNHGFQNARFAFDTQIDSQV
jgi:hypothetical protein